MAGGGVHAAVDRETEAAVERSLARHFVGIGFFTSGVLFSLSFATARGVEPRILLLSLIGGVANYATYRWWLLMVRDERSSRGLRSWPGLAALVAVGALPVIVFMVLLRLV